MRKTTVSDWLHFVRSVPFLRYCSWDWYILPREVMWQRTCRKLSILWNLAGCFYPKLPEASFCAYRGANPSVVVNGTTCKRSDGGTEVPMEVLTARQPPVLYILLGTNVLNRDGDYSSFLTYYRLMLDMISQALPNTQIYVQSITPVRPEVRSSHPGLYKERLCEINNELAAIALEKNCAFLNLWEALADDNGDLKAEYAQPDGIHIKPEGYPAWVEYLATHTVGQQTA